MDRDRFDAWTRLFAVSRPRRGALSALLGAAVAGPIRMVSADKNRRKRKTKRRGTGHPVTAQAVDCLSLGHGTNVSGCNYTGEDHSGEDLSSSRMVGTIFRDGTLARTDLSSSTLKNAVFRGANMCEADLRSSNVAGANFRDANLTLANFKSSGGCNSATFTAGTTFCRTTMCDGSVRNDDCPNGPPADFCCADDQCPVGQECQENACCTTDPVAAIEAAADGATVRVCAGTYRVVNLFIAKNLTIVGAGAEATIFDGQQESRVVWFRRSDTTIEVRDLTITGGKSGLISGGGGILNQSMLTLIGVTVRNNSAIDLPGGNPVGGGIANRGGSLTMTGVTVRDNEAVLNGGGIFNSNGAILTLGTGTRIERNTAASSGGGIFNNSTMTMQNGSRVENNTATAGSGGGIFNSGSVTIDPGAIVINNTPDNCEPTIGTCS